MSLFQPIVPKKVGEMSSSSEVCAFSMVILVLKSESKHVVSLDSGLWRPSVFYWVDAN
jgi:hypothetical protein